jgi:hypothetical protein
MLHHIDFKLGDLTVWVEKKSQEKNRFKSLFNIVNKLNTSTKACEKEAEQTAKCKEKHYCCFKRLIKHKC